MIKGLHKLHNPRQYKIRSCVEKRLSNPTANWIFFNIHICFEKESQLFPSSIKEYHNQFHLHLCKHLPNH